MEEKSLSVIENKKLLLNTVAKGATEAEFLMFLEFCKSTGLNPYKKEIWFIKTDKGVQMMTGINGFLAIANRNPNYDGMEVSIDEQDGKLISATAKVYRKDRRYPSCATVYFNEYFKPTKFGNGMWEKMPKMMLQKVAKSVALREAFPQELGGLYIQEEMPSEYSVPKEEKQYIYDLSFYHDAEKINGILEAYKNKGYKVEGNILYTNRPIEQLKECAVVDSMVITEEKIIKDEPNIDFNTVSTEIE